MWPESCQRVISCFLQVEVFFLQPCFWGHLHKLPVTQRERKDMFALTEEESACRSTSSSCLATAFFLLPSSSSPLLLLSLLLLLIRYCSSSVPVPPGSMKKAPLARHRLHATMGRQLYTALMCWYWDIFSYQIWIMHLIFLATLLVSTLSPWLHPSLASSGTYRKSLLAFILSL